jgi:hypothetical protein
MGLLTLEPDDLTNVFNHLTPEDFVRDTSASGTQSHPEALRNLGLNQGPIGYNLFVDLWLTECRRRAGTEDDFAPFAVLANADIERYFEGEDDEVPADFAGRLHREAKQMNAARMFVAMVAPARAVYKDDEPPQPISGEDIDAIQQALMTGDLDLCICWTSSLVADGTRIDRAGIMYLDDDGQIGQEIEAPVNPDTDPFKGVLT